MSGKWIVGDTKRDIKEVVTQNGTFTRSSGIRNIIGKEDAILGTVKKKIVRTLSQILENKFGSRVSQDTKPGRHLLLVACTSDLDKKENSITHK